MVFPKDCLAFYTLIGGILSRIAILADDFPNEKPIERWMTGRTEFIVTNTTAKDSIAAWPHDITVAFVVDARGI
jgi:hypothetical protein